MFVMKKLNILSISILALIFTACSSVTRVACVGDSITYGYGIPNDSAYPVVLSRNLGSKYSVLNFGESGKTLQKNSGFSYWSCKELTNVMALRPNIIIIKLGTNDTKHAFWNADNYAKDYQALVDTFRTIPGNPRIYLCLPVPVFKTNFGITEAVLTSGVLPIVEQTAKLNGLTLIDLYHPMKDQATNFPDGVHPNAKAAKKMADIITSAIKK